MCIPTLGGFEGGFEVGGARERVHFGDSREDLFFLIPLEGVGDLVGFGIEEDDADAVVGLEFFAHTFDGMLNAFAFGDLGVLSRKGFIHRLAGVEEEKDRAVGGREACSESIGGLEDEAGATALILAAGGEKVAFWFDPQDNVFARHKKLLRGDRGYRFSEGCGFRLADDRGRASREGESGGVGGSVSWAGRASEGGRGFEEGEEAKRRARREILSWPC